MKPRTTPADGSGAESVEGRRPVEGRARANACPGHRAGPGMSPTASAHGPELDGPPKPRMPVASDLRQEPGAGKPHAGICAGGRRQLLSLPRRAPGEAGAIQPVEREGGSARPVASVAGSSATVVLKRTQRDDEDCIELRKILTVEAEALRTAAGNMHETVLRGTVAPPESSSSRQGSCRNLGDLMPPAVATAIPGRFGKVRS